jgi:hypothetical protein
MKIKKINILIATIIGFTSFCSLAGADMKCYKEPSNTGAELNTGTFDKQANMQQGYDNGENPAAELAGCFAQTAFEGPQSIVSNHCGCKEAIQKLCKFDWDDGHLDISASGGASRAWCVPFSFMAG